MKKPNVSNFFRIAKEAVSKYTPEILTGIGVAGMVTTTVLAVKATPKALKLIEEEKERKTEQNRVEAKRLHHDAFSVCNHLTRTETIKVAWKPYIPAIVTGTVSTACLIGASSVNFRRNAALAAAYKFSETALAEYKEAVVETIGEKKEKMVKDKVAENRVESTPVEESKVIVTGNGTTKCLDMITGQYFYSNMEAIKKVENEMNHTMINDGYVSLNMVLKALGLESSKLDLGWSHDRTGLLKFYFSSHLDKDGTPCLVLDYDEAPIYDYDRFVY